MLSYTQLDQKKKNTMIIAALIFIIVFGVIRFCYAFFVQKQDFHSDETWSYGLANSYYEPYIYTDADEQYNKNICFWASEDILHNYLTVQPEQRFSYGSTYYNLSKDLHPPLYFFILHTICSIFPDTFSYTYGFFINIFSFVIMSIFLFKTIKLATDSNKAGLLGVAFNTFTTGCLSIVIFIRMYAMAAMFSVVLTYYLFRIYKEYKDTKKVKLSSFIGAAIATLLGALTHHFFLVYAFIITVIFTIYYIVKKAWKVFAELSAFMLGSVAVSIALFPATISHLFSGGSATSSSASERIFDFKFQFSAMIMHLSQEIFGFSWITPYKNNVFIYILIALVIIALLFAGGFLLFKLNKKPDILHIALFFSIVFVIIICAYIVNYSDMLEFSDRYMFVIFPITVIFVVITTHSLLSAFNIQKNIRYSLMTVLIMIALIMTNLNIHSPYLLTKSKQYGATLDDIASENSDILILSSSRWMLTSYSGRLLGASSYFYTLATPDYLIALEDSIETLDSAKPLYLVLDITNIDVTNVDVDPASNNTLIVKSDADSKNETEYVNYASYKQYVRNIISEQTQSSVSDEYELELYDYLSYVYNLSICEDFTFVGYDSIFSYPVLIYKLN